MSRERGKDVGQNSTGGVRWVEVWREQGVRAWVGGGSPIVTTRKQSNTNSSHSRGTAGAHIDSFLGGPGGSEKEIVRAWARMKDREIERDGEGFGRGQRCWKSRPLRRGSAGKTQRRPNKKKTGVWKAATCEFSLYPTNHGKSIRIHI